MKKTSDGLFAGTGGLGIGLERVGTFVAIANEIMHDSAATLAAAGPSGKAFPWRAVLSRHITGRTVA